MKLLVPLFTVASLVIQAPAFAASMSHPEEAYPDDMPPLASPEGPDKEFFQQIQAKLHLAGFDAGPVNGSFGLKTQTALGQFQQANGLPVSGMTDAATLMALGVDRPKTAE